MIHQAPPSHTSSAGTEFPAPRVAGVASVVCATLVALVCTVSSPAVAAITATTADDICAPTADPCVINQKVDVTDGALLDFGLRRVEIDGIGELRFDIGSATLLVGELAVDVGGAAFTVKGTLDGLSYGGDVSVDARRACSGNASLPCLNDFNCSTVGAGTCSLGTGTIVFDGKIIGNADTPGTVTLSAAGDITAAKLVNLNSTSLEGDGGLYELHSTFGSVTVTEKLDLSGGGNSTGGEVLLVAGLDVTTSDFIDVPGGDFDGGTLEIIAGRDVLITQDFNANSVNGEGFGGTVAVTAGRDLSILGGTSSNRLTISTEGHMSSENFGGDGGEQLYEAGRDMVIGEFVKFEANGASPDGFGEEIQLSAVGDVTFAGEAVTKGKGLIGGGGIFRMIAGNRVEATAASAVDITGSAGGSGDVIVESGGDIVFDGTIAASGASGGVGGGVTMDAGADVFFGGTIVSAGSPSTFATGTVALEGCRVSVTGTIDNTAEEGGNILTARESVTVSVGAFINADAVSGTNSVVYRSASKPPTLLGTISPQAVQTLDGTLVGCPVCGNNEIDQGETCDDGGLIGGDGCSAQCQSEGCIAETPGYPAVPLCDDGDECTADTCNGTLGVCEHTGGCDDGIDCTVDTCNGAACVFTPSDASCDDGNVCTAGSCSTVAGCQQSDLTGPCDDGLFCNGTDTCSAGICGVHAGDPCTGGAECADTCDETSDTCFTLSGTACTDDGEPCTNDECDGAGACAHPPNAASCDDGLFCNGADNCSGGSCSTHAGDPCVGGAECRATCNEGSGGCLDPPGTACTEDGNPCTDDVCDVSGGCSHLDNGVVCDDGDLCTVTDQCAAATCSAVDVRDFTVGKLSMKFRDGLDDDRVLLKAEIPLHLLAGSPEVSGMTLVLDDVDGAALFTATVPEQLLVDVGGKGRIFKFLDRTGTLAGGIQRAIVKKISNKGVARVLVKGGGLDLAAAAGQSGLSLSILFGTDPAVDDCASARGLLCESRSTKSSCESP